MSLLLVCVCLTGVLLHVELHWGQHLRLSAPVVGISELWNQYRPSLLPLKQSVTILFEVTMKELMKQQFLIYFAWIKYPFSIWLHVDVSPLITLQYNFMHDHTGELHKTVWQSTGRVVFTDVWYCDFYQTGGGIQK